jgi:formylglycine-generating enzyme required for sulfatase activity
MVMVNARDAQAYADWALKKLPTEAQWELAIRSTDGRLYPWGAEPSKPPKPTGAAQIGPVMAQPADLSPYGVFDMAGNALEWTKDWYDSRYYRQLPLEEVSNPSGPSVKPRSLELVVKGDRKTGSGATRQGIMLEKRLNYVGFRCVLPVAEQREAVTAAPGAPGQVPAPRPGVGSQPSADQPPPF